MHYARTIHGGWVVGEGEGGGAGGTTCVFDYSWTVPVNSLPYLYARHNRYIIYCIAGNFRQTKFHIKSMNALEYNFGLLIFRTLKRSLIPRLSPENEANWHS